MNGNDINNEEITGNVFVIDEKIKEARLSLNSLANAVESVLISYTKVGESLKKASESLKKAGNFLKESFDKINTTSVKDSVKITTSNKNLNELQSHLKILNNELKVIKYNLNHYYQEKPDELAKDDDEKNYSFSLKEFLKSLARAIFSIQKSINFLTQIKWLKYIKKFNKLIFSLTKDVPIIRILRKYYNQTHTYSENQFFNSNSSNLFSKLLKNDFYETRKSCFNNQKYYPYRYQYI